MHAGEKGGEIIIRGDDGRCNMGLGTCSKECGDPCCNTACAQRFPDQEASGYCQVAAPPGLDGCVCTYQC